MSIVNSMASDVWSDADINTKVQAIIRSQITQEDEMKASRLDRKATKDQGDLDFIAHVDSVIADAVGQGRQARVDMALLSQALRIEQATARLACPLIEPELDDQGAITNQAIMDLDLDVRAGCQADIDSASTEAMALFDLRNPPAPPDPTA